MENTEEEELLTEEEEQLSAARAEEAARKMISPAESAKRDEALLQELLERAEADQDEDMEE